MFNSDDVKYGGAGITNKTVTAQEEPMHGEQYRITLDLPPMSVMFFKIKNMRTPPSKLLAEKEAADAEKAAKAVKAEKVEKPVKPEKEEKTVKAEAPAKKPETPAAPEKKSEAAAKTDKAGHADKGDNSKKITAQKVGTGGNI